MIWYNEPMMSLLWAVILISNLVIAADDDSNYASQRKQAVEKYKDFLKYVKERETADKIHKKGVEDLKAKREKDAAAHESARRQYLEKREQLRRTADPDIRDQILQTEIEAEKQRRQEREKLFAANRKRLKEVLKNVPQVDPHDEFQVGEQYEEFEYEEEPEEKKEGP